MHPTHFASFAHLFDETTPMMREHMAGIDRKLRELYTKMQQEQTVRNIKIMTVRALLDQYPLPDGIDSEFYVNGDNDHVRFFRGEGTDLQVYVAVVPFDALAEYLPQAIASIPF